MKTKKIIFVFLILIGFSSGLNGYSKYNNIDFEYFEKNNIKYYEYKGILETIIDMSLDNNFDNENFYLKIKVFVSSNGNMRYILLNQSQGGYNNKILVINKLEEIKKISFQKEMKSIQKYNDDLKYKEFSFIYEVGKQKEGF